nr:hypothetical protein [Mycobacteroides immunogenum]
MREHREVSQRDEAEQERAECEARRRHDGGAVHAPAGACLGEYGDPVH